MAVVPASISYGRVPSSNRSGTDVARRGELVRVERLEQSRVGDRGPEVRPEELVRRAGEEVRAELDDVDRSVRRQVDPVDVDQSPRPDEPRR